MYKVNWIFIGAFFGFISVAFGAFGSHLLKGILSPENFEIWDTGVNYQMFHAVVIIVLGYRKEKYSLSCFLFTIGVLLFSFSLYLYSYTNLKAFAMITPLGGLLLLSGWLILMVQSFVKNDHCKVN